MKGKRNQIKVHDRMQQGYEYLLTKPRGKEFAAGFKPELTPKQMLGLGVFGGKYMTDCEAEFPADWFAHARLCPGHHDPELNFFGVNASQPLSVWRRKGWIYEEDPRGWFQWYCRYYLGRRCPDDQRQIKRWRAVRRHIAQLQKNCQRGELTAGRGSARACCTGPTTRGNYDPLVRLEPRTFLTPVILSWNRTRGSASLWRDALRPDSAERTCRTVATQTCIMNEKTGSFSQSLGRNEEGCVQG